MVSPLSGLLGLPPRGLRGPCSPRGKTPRGRSRVSEGTGSGKGPGPSGLLDPGKGSGSCHVGQRAIDSCGAWWQHGLGDVWGHPLQGPDENEPCVVGGRASEEEITQAGAGPPWHHPGEAEAVGGRRRGPLGISSVGGVSCSSRRFWIECAKSQMESAEVPFIRVGDAGEKPLWRDIQASLLERLSRHSDVCPEMSRGRATYEPRSREDAGAGDTEDARSLEPT